MIDLETVTQETEKRAQALCAGMGIELVELKTRIYRETLNIELFVDFPTGGIGIEACTKLNRLLDRQLDEEMKLGNNYTLEVSSPGLDRPLITFADFRRSVGKNIRLFLRERHEGKMEMDAVIKGVRGNEIVFGIKQGELSVGIEQIAKGRQILF